MNDMHLSGLAFYKIDKFQDNGSFITELSRWLWQGTRDTRREYLVLRRALALGHDSQTEQTSTTALKEERQSEYEQSDGVFAFNLFVYCLLSVN